VVLTPLLLGVYLVHPQSVHRFVGYLEETAVHTYNNVVTHLETPGTLLHQEWSNSPAPTIAIVCLDTSDLCALLLFDHDL
jgi:hypothetical protein